jgi:hypothetical protein
MPSCQCLACCASLQSLSQCQRRLHCLSYPSRAGSRVRWRKSSSAEEWMSCREAGWDYRRTGPGNRDDHTGRVDSNLRDDHTFCGGRRLWSCLSASSPLKRSTKTWESRSWRGAGTDAGSGAAAASCYHPQGQDFRATDRTPRQSGHDERSQNTSRPFGLWTCEPHCDLPNHSNPRNCILLQKITQQNSTSGSGIVADVQFAGTLTRPNDSSFHRCNF